MKSEVKVQVRSGQQAVASAGTAEALVASTTWARNVIFTAPAGNTGNVFLGDSTVDATSGLVVAPGGQVNLSDLLGGEAYVTDLATVYVDAANNDDAISWIYFDRV